MVKKNISRIRQELSNQIDGKQIEVSIAVAEGDTSEARTLQFQVDQWKQVLKNSRDVVDVPDTE